ncbi:MAG: hypothetical protein AB1942_10200 [Pseudomonadota bacterium]
MRILSPVAAASLALSLAACAAAGSGRDVAAVVQDERARQAVAQAADNGEGAKAALSAATPASAAEEPPHRP